MRNGRLRLAANLRSVQEKSFLAPISERNNYSVIIVTTDFFFKEGTIEPESLPDENFHLLSPVLMGEMLSHGFVVPY